MVRVDGGTVGGGNRADDHGERGTGEWVKRGSLFCQAGEREREGEICVLHNASTQLCAECALRDNRRRKSQTGMKEGKKEERRDGRRIARQGASLCRSYKQKA